jgi:exodeoxyribonuclease VII small subunit
MNRVNRNTVDWAPANALTLHKMPKTPDKTGLFAEETAGEAAPPAASDDDVSRFEDAMGELETIVAQMERGELKLEESLRLFERGMQLTRQCRQSLDTAELKVRNLLADDAGAESD